MRANDVLFDASEGADRRTLERYVLSLRSSSPTHVSDRQRHPTTNLGMLQIIEQIAKEKLMTRPIVTTISAHWSMPTDAHWTHAIVPTSLPLIS